jgi:hypothetical protein
VLLQEPRPPQRFDRSTPRSVVTVAWAHWHLSAGLGLIKNTPAGTPARRVPAGSGAEVLCGRISGEALCN